MTSRRDESITLRCTVCGKPYHPRRDRVATARACSRECARRLGVQAMNGGDATTPFRSSDLLTCPQCQRPFRASKAGQRYCSRACANRQRGKPSDNSQPSQECPGCRRSFTPRKRHQQYCSLACYQRRRDIGTRERQTCPRCGTIFTPKRPGQRFCSRACAWMREALPSRECRWCHQTFIPKTRAQVYCSPLCQRGGALSRVTRVARESAAANAKRQAAQLQRLENGQHNWARKPTAPQSGPGETQADKPGSAPQSIEPDGGRKPLAYPLEDMDARAEWRMVGDLREAQADALLRREETRTSEGRTVILAGQGSYLGVEGGALILHQGRTHGVPAP